MSIDNSENITYYLNEEETTTNVDLTELLNEFEEFNMINNTYETEDTIMSEIKNYELNYTIKKLLEICEYYGLTKNKSIKLMKKNELIMMIILFEKDIDNIEAVMRRKELWFYLDELKSDKMTKKYVIW